MPAAMPAPDPRPGPFADPLLALADRCVQCGLCLPACPTYRLDREETESPRGRIALARGLADGTLQASLVADAHLDHCLGCRRCEAVCPAGVQYAEVLTSHGAHRYSIYLDESDGSLFGYVEVEDEARWNAIAETAVCRRWWTY